MKECVKIQNEGNCTHNVKLRQFIGTYTLREVSFAISLGYVITELHELLIYPRREFIYKDIVNTLASYKIRNSIDKNEFASQMDLQEFLTEINFKSGFLDQDLIITEENCEDNPALRYLFKQIINNYIGTILILFLCNY